MDQTSKHLPHIIKRAHFAIRQTLDNELAKHGLTSAQGDVLMRIADCECAEHRSLLQDMEVASPTLTKLVNSLVDSGYIKRGVSPNDARVKVLTLTKDGKAIHQKLRNAYPGYLTQFFKDFTAEEREQLTDMLTRLVENIENATS